MTAKLSGVAGSRCHDYKKQFLLVFKTSLLKVQLKLELTNWPFGYFFIMLSPCKHTKYLGQRNE